MTVTLNMPQPRMTRHATEATLVDVDETTALLGKPASQDDDIDTFKRQALAKGRPTPVPWGQLLALCATRLSDPISFTHIFVRNLPMLPAILAHALFHSLTLTK
jgi:hypothetical protein